MIFLHLLVRSERILITLSTTKNEIRPQIGYSGGNFFRVGLELGQRPSSSRPAGNASTGRNALENLLRGVELTG